MSVTVIESSSNIQLFFFKSILLIKYSQPVLTFFVAKLIYLRIIASEFINSYVFQIYRIPYQKLVLFQPPRTSILNQLRKIY